MCGKLLAKSKDITSSGSSPLRGRTLVPRAAAQGVRLLCLFLFIEAGAILNSLPVAGSPASGIVPVHISGSFVPGAVVEVRDCGKALPFVVGCHIPGWR